MSEAGAEFHFSPRPNRASEINWHAWSPTAFEEAKETRRPILLSISAVWCHWCHVMDETSYSDPAVIAGINEGYIPIRVDNDERPDVNRRYNTGGWPTTAFRPVGDILTGRLLPPPDQMASLDQDRRSPRQPGRDRVAF
jgi:thiol:disulfide interchange protein